MGEEERFKKCKRSVRGIRRKNEHRSKEVGEDRYCGRRRFQKKGTTRKVYSKNVYE